MLSIYQCMLSAVLYFTPKMLKITVILKELFTQEKTAVILTDLFTQETVRNTSENNIPIFHRSC